MKVSAFNGSPKGAKGNTDMIVQAFLRGAAEAGAEVETIYLADHCIHHCHGCFACWFKTPGQCILRNDMDVLLQKYVDSDVVCLATPVYTWNMTAYLKNFVDRLAPLKSPLLTHKGGHYDLEDTENRQTQYVAMANAGFPGANNFDTIRAVFASCNPKLEIYRNCGMALRKEDARVLAYLKTVQQAGYQLIADGDIDREVRGMLEEAMIPEAEYIAMLGM